jgi:AAHS family 4-hydroxybenzoate transporter-like MFS transporter
MTDQAIDAAHILDNQPLGWFQIRVMALCAAVIAFDGFDAQALGFVAPVLSREWRLPPGALGPVFGAALTGMLIGAVAFGSLADYLGRKRFIVLGTLVFGLGALATTMVRSLDALLIVRFLTGIGLGGVMPNAIALTSEYSPRSRRTIMVMVMFSAVTIGSALGGALAARLIPVFGWQGVFWVGALLPIAVAPALLAWLPESLHVLAARPDRAGVDALLRRIDPRLAVAPGSQFVMGHERQPAFRTPHLFRQERLPVTLLLWVIFFMNLLDIYFLNNWLPTLFDARGLGLNAAIFISVMFQLGGALGTFGLGWLIGRAGFFSVLSLNFLVGCASVLALGWSGATAFLAPCAFLAGACVIGGQGGCNALAVHVYPPFVRSTGVGWALGVGRVGSIVGPVVGGLMLAAHWTVPALFMASALPQLVAALVVVLIGMVMRGGGGSLTKG